MEQFWTLAANQGFSVLLLGIAVFYFYKREIAWEAKVTEMQKTHEAKNEAVQKERTEERTKLIQLIEQMGNVVEKNTESINRLEHLFSPNHDTSRDKIKKREVA